MGLDMYLEKRDSDNTIGYWRKANAIHKWFVEHVQDGKDDCGQYLVSKENLLELQDSVNEVLRGSKLVKGKVANGYKFDKDGKKIPMLEDGKIIEHPGKAMRFLPTQDGFFFGGIDYDQYYIDDLKATRKIIKDALEAIAGGADIYYHSSW